MQPTIASRLTEFAHAFDYERLPPEVVEKTKLLVLDTVGIALGSSQLDFGRSVLDLVARWGGSSDAGVIGGGKVPAHHAAFANGTLAHGQDFDDTHTESVVHSSAALVPVALAVGEREGRGGRDVLTAAALGTEIAIRLGLPALNRFHLRGFHTTSICATFGASVTTAVLAGLDRMTTVQALGIGGSFTSGLLECIGAGVGAKRLHAGWAGLCGIVATDLASAGFTGPETIFEGRLGLFRSFLRGEDLDLDVIEADLGERWDILDVRPKLYPCCHYLQAFLDCAAMLRREGVRPEQIAAIRCSVSPGAVNIVCEPWAGKLAPKNGYDSRFSLPFAVAAMLARGKSGISEFSEASFGDAVIQDLMTKVSYEANPHYEVKDMPGYIEVLLTDGSRRTAEIPQVRGDARNPIAASELLDKFHANAQWLGRAESERLAAAILDLDRLENIGVLTAIGTTAAAA